MKTIQWVKSCLPKQEKPLFKKGLAILLVVSLSLTAFLAFNPKVTYAVTEYEVLSLQCTKDAYVDERYPNENFGTNTTLLVRSYQDQNARAFFDFSYDTIPIGANVINATLIIYLDQSPISYRKYVMNVARGEWNETGTEGNITWNNQPGVDWGYKVDEVPVTPATTELRFDVTRAVQEYVCVGWMLDGFMIRDTREYDWRTAVQNKFVAREHSTKPSAVLNVTISYEPDFLLWVMPDYNSAFPGGSTSYWYTVASLNQWEGTVDLEVGGLHGTMTPTFSEDPLNLMPGDIRWGQLEITTTVDTPNGEYNLRVTGTNSITHGVNVTLEIIPRVFVRDLPATAQNNTDFRVILNYYTGVINTNSLIIEEELPEHVSLVNTTMPTNVNFAYNSTHQDGNRLFLKFVVINQTALNSFNIIYWVHLSLPPEAMVGSLPFWGRYKYLLTNGVSGEENTLGDSNVEIPVGFQGGWDDDDRVDDWELIEIIRAWVAGDLADDTLIHYIELWQNTSW